MRRIILLVALALLLAAFVVVSALPAIAAPPSKLVLCSNGSSFSTNEAEGFGGQGRFTGECRSGGNTSTQEVDSNPGPANPFPPGKGNPPLP